MTIDVLKTVATIFRGMNKDEAHRCLDTLVTIYNEGVIDSEKLSLTHHAGAQKTKPRGNYRRSGAKIWCKVVNSVPSGEYTMRDVGGESVWSPYDFADYKSGALVAGGRSKSSDRFIGVVKPGAEANIHDTEMTGIDVVFQTSKVDTFLKELAHRFT